MNFDDKILEWYSDYISALMYQYHYSEEEANDKGKRLLEEVVNSIENCLKYTTAQHIARNPGILIFIMDFLFTQLKTTNGHSVMSTMQRAFSL